MYRLQKMYCDTKRVECDSASAKRMMRNFLVENGLHITLPVKNSEDEGKRTLNPSVAKQNYVYDSETFRGIMVYDKKNGLLRICSLKGEDTRTVGDDEFMPTLMEMLKPWRNGGYEFSQFPDRLIISKDGYYVDEIFIEHFRRLRNAKGEIVEERILAQN